MPWNVLIGVLNFQKCWKPLTILKVKQFLVSGTGVHVFVLSNKHHMYTQTQ